MSGKDTGPSEDERKRPKNKTVRIAGLDTLPAAPPLSDGLRAQANEHTMESAASDPDMGRLPEGFWDNATIVEPDGTEQVTLRLPRRVLRHFRATGKGYQSRISAVLSGYVDAVNRRKPR